ncbi:SDR family NAD(P)-dependent oxidoreductase [Nocardia mexicana]|uniref:Short-subunit dehydrogenase n=1 Tax=Nocardia mexicana TaxID=279262 RepID=A0A370GM93_9NOCA|nr:SDR family NAD(P)-dependent oxidoreductase [Nocardia mexicana]RDI44409.1 short-subunit dehydrogenase [Nocardia mexicana]
MPHGQLTDSRVLLTGATGGIGHAVAREFATEGAELVVTGRRSDVLDVLASELGATAIAADLSDAAQVARLAADSGPVDVLIANAGLPAGGHLLELSTTELDRIVDVNLRAPMLLARHFAEGMLARGRGHIVFVGSIAGLLPAPMVSLYNATKFGLRGFSLALRHDLGSAGVGVSVVEPGFVRDAGMFADGGSSLPRGMRTVSPRQVARAVVRAVRDDVGEIVVAPLEVRLLARIGCVMPGLLAPLHRAMDAERLGAELGGGLRNKF